MAAFPRETEALLVELTAVGECLRKYEKRVQPDDRSFRVLSFLFLAFRFIATGGHLLASGMMLPAGNQLRSFREALAMALLLSVPEEQVLETYDVDPRAYSIQKAPDRLLRDKTKQRLGLGPGAAEMARVFRFYDRLSHASVFAELEVTHTRGYELRPRFQENLKPLYRRQLLHLVLSARTLRQTIGVMIKRFSETRAPASPGQV